MGSREECGEYPESALYRQSQVFLTQVEAESNEDMLILANALIENSIELCFRNG